MSQSLAEYRNELKDESNLRELAVLDSKLFSEPLHTLTDDEKWKPDFERIFQLLHLNYSNPRAMNCFIFYDIEDNKLRLKIAKYLLEKGCQRIQKSVYLANISQKIYQEIFETMVELEEIFDEDDSIFIVPIGEYHLAEMKLVGKDVDMSFARSSKYVIFI